MAYEITDVWPKIKSYQLKDQQGLSTIEHIKGIKNIV